MNLEITGSNQLLIALVRMKYNIETGLGMLELVDLFENECGMHTTNVIKGERRSCQKQESPIFESCVYYH